MQAGGPSSNAISQGTQSKIETLWKTARGYRDGQRFRAAIRLHLGGPDPTPST